MAFLNAHPDYLRESKHYAVYETFLSAIQQYAECWHALPREVAEWWRKRAAVQIAWDGDGFMGVLAELWTAAGKALEADRLQVYRQSLGEVPLGLLELAVRQVIRENVYHVVPLPGVVWTAVRRELGDPWDIKLAMEDWVERRWGRK
jgi:hypothetical protein